MGNSVSVAPEEGGTDGTDVVSTLTSALTSSLSSGGSNVKKERKPTTTKSTEREECREQKLQYAVSGMKGWRPTMEDQHVFSSHLVVNNDVALSDHAIFAIFDGHGGGYTSQYLKDNFLTYFCARPELQKYAALEPSESETSVLGPKGGRSDCHGVKLLKDALTATFVEVDERLRLVHEQYVKKNSGDTSASSTTMLRTSSSGLGVGVTEAWFSNSSGNNNATDGTSSNIKPSPSFINNTPLSPIDRSGSTAVVVLIAPQHIICANAGDSRAVLRRRRRDIVVPQSVGAGSSMTLPLSFDHKPHHVVERKRIVHAGGTVLRKRIDGDLAVSRALGDFCMKKNDALPAHEQKVSCRPDCIVYPRQFDCDEYIILACDGVWDVATNEQCASFIEYCLLCSLNETRIATTQPKIDGADDTATAMVATEATTETTQTATTTTAAIDLGAICEAALDRCLEHNSRDNMTLMLVGFSDNLPHVGQSRGSSSGKLPQATPKQSLSQHQYHAAKALTQPKQSGNATVVRGDQRNNSKTPKAATTLGSQQHALFAF